LGHNFIFVITKIDFCFFKKILMKRIAGWGQLNNEDALTAKVDVLTRTRRYKQVCRPERAGSAGEIPLHAAGGNRLAGDQEPRQPHEHARLDPGHHPDLGPQRQQAGDRRR
jgi:hypothetical protein